MSNYSKKQPNDNKDWRKHIRTANKGAYAHYLDMSFNAPKWVRQDDNLNNTAATLFSLLLIFNKGTGPNRNLTGTQAGILNVKESEIFEAQRQLVDNGYIEIYDDVTLKTRPNDTWTGIECIKILIERAPRLQVEETATNGLF